MATATLPVQDPVQDETNAPETEQQPLDPNLVSALKSMLTHYSGLEKYVRREEVIDARRQRFYEQGYQYIYFSSAAWMFAPVTNTGGGGAVGQSNQVNMPRYRDVYNIYQPFERGIMAILTENPPGVDFEPDDPSLPEDVDAAKKAEKLRIRIDIENPRKNLQCDIARLFCTDGRVLLYSRTEIDKDTGESKDIIESFGVLESKVPLITKTIKEWPYAILSKELDINIAKAEYPEIADKIRKGGSDSGESSYERMARLGVMQSTRMQMQADAYAHLVTRHIVWYRKCAYEQLGADSKSQRPSDHPGKAILESEYPDGCKVIYVGGEVAEVIAESMDDHLAVKHPMPGDGMHRASLLKLIVPVQDAYNDYKNLEKEIYDYTVPKKYVAQDIIDVDALQEQINEPGNTVPCNMPTPGAKLSDFMHEEEASQVPASMIAAYQDLRGQFAQFQTAVLPALFGAAEADNTTRGGIAMMRDQAMGQMGLAWGALQELMAESYEQAIRNRAKANPDDTVSIPGAKGKPDSVPMADILKGKFHCYPDTDSSFPETTAAKRQVFMTLMTEAATNPFTAETLVLPKNLEMAKRLTGLSELEIPGADAQQKQLAEIEMMLQGTGPVPSPPPDPNELIQAGAAWKQAAAQAQLTGTPEPPRPTLQQVMPPQPSIPVDPDWDFHQYEFQTIQDWLSSPEGLEAKADPMLAAQIQDIKLHGLAHQKLIPPPPMPGPPPIPVGLGKKPPQGAQPNA
jgi:hypothetical protein